MTVLFCQSVCCRKLDKQNSESLPWCFSLNMEYGIYKASVNSRIILSERFYAISRMATNWAFHGQSSLCARSLCNFPSICIHAIIQPYSSRRERQIRKLYRITSSWCWFVWVGACEVGRQRWNYYNNLSQGSYSAAAKRALKPSHKLYLLWCSLTDN